MDTTDYVTLESMGYYLTPIQKYWLRAMQSEKRCHLHLKHDRQTGGTYTVEAYMWEKLIQGKSIVYLAQRRDTAKSTMERMTWNSRDCVPRMHGSIHGKPVKVHRTHGKERIEVGNGVVRFGSLHGKKSMRGYSFDIVIVDAQTIRPELMRDLKVMTAASAIGKFIHLESVELNPDLYLYY